MEDYKNIEKKIDPHKKRNLNLSTLFLGVISLLAISILFLTFYPTQVIKPNVQPYKVLTPNVRIGESLIYVVDACKYIDVQSEVSRTFIDAKNKTQYPAIIGKNSIHKGCDKTPVSVTVPNYLIPGEYFMTLDVTYKLNSFQDRQYSFTTDTFMVLY